MAHIVAKLNVFLPTKYQECFCKLLKTDVKISLSVAGYLFCPSHRMVEDLKVSSLTFFFFFSFSFFLLD